MTDRPPAPGPYVATLFDDTQRVAWIRQSEGTTYVVWHPIGSGGGTFDVIGETVSRWDSLDFDTAMEDAKKKGLNT